MKTAMYARAILIGFVLLLAGCGKADMDGIVLEVTGNSMLVATELSLEEYEEIKNQSATEIQNEDVNGDSYLGLINITYKRAEKFSKGDEVDLWIDGDIRESYPMGATAKKATLKK